MKFYGISFVYHYKQYQAHSTIDKTAYMDARNK